MGSTESLFAQTRTEQQELVVVVQRAVGVVPVPVLIQVVSISALEGFVSVEPNFRETLKSETREVKSLRFERTVLAS